MTANTRANQSITSMEKFMIYSLGGSRHLSINWLDTIASVASKANGQISVGCCVGADEMLLQLAITGELPINKLRVFTSFGPGGKELVPGLSAWESVRKFESMGGEVIYTPTAELKYPPALRLRNRTLRVVNSGTGEFFLFSGPVVGRGSELVLKSCQKRDVIQFRKIGERPTRIKSPQLALF